MTGSNDDIRNGFTFVWTVQKNIRGLEPTSGLLQTTPEILSSPPFYVESLQNTGWCVIMVISKKSEHITCSLSRIIKDSGPKNIDVDLEIAFLAADNSPMVRKTRRYLFDHNEACVFESFAKKTDVLVGRKCDILHNECLRVRCRMWKAADMLPRSVLCFAHTDLGTESEVFYWAIDRFSLLKIGEKRSFCVKPKFQAIQTIILSASLNESGEVQLQLTSEDTKLMISTNWEISVVDSIGRTADSSHFNFLIRNKRVSLMPSLTTLSKLMANRALYLPNDILLLKCHYATRYTSEILYDSQIPSSGKDDMNLFGGQEFKSCENVTNSPMTLINDLAGLYKERILCDVNLKAGGVTFPAHKNVLSARSQEFRELFTYDAKDNAFKDIELPDLYPDTVSKMLKFIYTNTVEDLHECNVVNLYFAADKYKLLPLKSKCSEYLKATLSLSNIVDALELAERYHDDDLKAFVLNYVLNHDEEFLQSNYWESFKTHHKQLAFKIMENVCLKKLGKN